MDEIGIIYISKYSPYTRSLYNDDEVHRSPIMASGSPHPGDWWRLDLPALVESGDKPASKG